MGNKTENSFQPTSASPALPGEAPGWSEGTDTIITQLVEELALTGSANLQDVSQPGTWKSFSEKATSLIMEFAVIRCH